MAKSQSIKQNNLNALQLQLQLQQQHISQQLSTVNQNNNLANCSKSQLHEEFQSEMISQPHLNANAGTQEQANNTNPNIKDINNFNNINSTSFNYNPYHYHNQYYQQGYIPSQYQQTSQIQNQSSNNNRKQSQVHNTKHSLMQLNNQSGMIGGMNQSGQVDGASNIGFAQQPKMNSIFDVGSIQDQQMHAILGGFWSQQLQYENNLNQDQQNTPTQHQKEISINHAGQNNAISIIQPQTSHFYNGPSNHIHQTSHTELTSMNGNQQKNNQKYQISDEIGYEISSYNQQGINAIMSMPSRAQITQTKMSEIMRDEYNPFMSNLVLKATTSEFGRPGKQNSKTQQTENNGGSEYNGEAYNYIGGESEGGIAIMNVMQFYQMGIDPNQLFNNKFGEELQNEEESGGVQSFRENSESVQSQQICLDDLNDEQEEEEKESKVSQEKVKQNDEDNQNEQTLDIDEQTKDNMNELQSQNMINKDHLIVLKKRIVKSKLPLEAKINESSVINELNEIQLNFLSQDMLNVNNNFTKYEEGIQNKKNKLRITFSPNIEQKLFIDDSVQNNLDLNEHESKIMGQNSNKNTPTTNQSQKQQRSIMKQRESSKVNLNDDTFQRMPQNSLLNSFGSVVNQQQILNNNQSNNLSDVPISSNLIKYNISFGRNFQEEFQNQENMNSNMNVGDEHTRYSQQILDQRDQAQSSGYRFSSPRDNISCMVSISSEIHSSPSQHIIYHQNIQNVLEFQHQGGVYFKNRKDQIIQKNLQSPEYKEEMKTFIGSENTSHEIIKDQDLLSPIQQPDQYFNQRQHLLQNKITFGNTPDNNSSSQQQGEYYFDNEVSYRCNKFRNHPDYQGRALFKNEGINNNCSQIEGNYDQDYIYSALSSNKLLNSNHHSRQNSNYFNSQQKLHSHGILPYASKDPSFSDIQNNFSTTIKQGIIGNNQEIAFEEENNYSNIHNSPEIKHQQQNQFPSTKLQLQTHYNIFNDNKSPYPSGSASSKNSYVDNPLELVGRSASTASNKKGGISKYFNNYNKQTQKNLSISSYIPSSENEKSASKSGTPNNESPQNKKFHQSLINFQRKGIQIAFDETNQQIKEQNFRQVSRSKSENKINIIENDAYNNEQILNSNCRDSLNNLQQDMNERYQGQNSDCQRIPESLTFTNQLLQPLSTQTGVNLTLTDNKLNQMRVQSNSFDKDNSPIGAKSLLAFNKEVAQLTKKSTAVAAKFNLTNLNNNNNLNNSTAFTNNTPSHYNQQGNQCNIFTNLPRQSSIKSIQDNIQSARLKTGGSSLAPQINFVNISSYPNQQDRIIDFQQYPVAIKQKSVIDQGSHSAIHSREELPIFSNDLIEGSSIPTKQGVIIQNTKTYSAITDKQTMAELDMISLTNNTPLPQKKDSKNQIQSQVPILKQSNSNTAAKSVAFNTQPSMSQILTQQQLQQQSIQLLQQQAYSNNIQKDHSHFQIQRMLSQSNHNSNNLQGGLYSPSAKSNPPTGTGAGVSFFKNNHTNLSNESFHQTNNLYPNQQTPTSNRNNAIINQNNNILYNLHLQRDQQSSSNIYNLQHHDSQTPQHTQILKRMSSNVNQFHKLSTGMRNTLNTVQNIIYTTQGNTSQIPNSANPNNTNPNTLNINMTNNNNNENNTMTNYTAPFYFEKRYCKLCNFDQPTRSKHCLICNRCISTYDHHCPWLGVCIAQRNHLFFFFFIVIQNVVTTFSIIDLIYYIVENIDQKVKQKIILSVISIASTLFLIYIFGMTIMLIAQHTYYILFNITTWEFYSWEKITYLKDLPRRFGSPFSLGVIKNIKHKIIATFSSHTYEWQVNKLRVPPYTNTITIQP